MPNARRSTPKEPSVQSTKQLGIRVPTQMSDRLEAIAKREHNGVSAVCRRLLAESLASHGDEAA
jgi:hypothetical protein